MNCKSLQELNSEFQLETQKVTAAKPLPVETITNLPKILVEPKPKTQKVSNTPKKHKGVFGIISDILFYLVILMILLAIITSGPKQEEPKTFMGYSYFTVLTTSMQDELPKGSFIVVKHTDPKDLKIGDNITFMRDSTTSVTHKIIGIYENYEDSGMRAFQTKGVNNDDPDKEIVYEKDIVGKVVFHIPGMGATIFFISEKIYIVFIIFGLCVIVSLLIRTSFSNKKRKNTIVKNYTN